MWLFGIWYLIDKVAIADGVYMSPSIRSTDKLRQLVLIDRRMLPYYTAKPKQRWTF